MIAVWRTNHTILYLERAMNPRRIFLTMIAIGFVVHSISFAQTTKPATMPLVDIWHEPTDVPTIKINDHGVPNPEFLKMHQNFLQRSKEGEVGVLFLGDSITNGWFW